MEPKTRCHFMFLGSGNCLFSAAEIVTVCVFTFRHSSSLKSEVTLFPLLKFMLLYSLNFSLAEVTEVPALPAHCWLSLLAISPSPGLPGPGHRCRPAPGPAPDTFLCKHLLENHQGLEQHYLGARVERNSVNTASLRSSSSRVLYLSPRNHIKSWEKN